VALPRTFMGFSSSDIRSYRLMKAWKAHEHVEFDFVDCQLQDEIRSDDEDYIKGRCRNRINMAGTFIQLIGADTRSKHKYVRWEAEVAIEKECRIIGVNLNLSTCPNTETCPPILQNAGVTFVSFSPQIVAHALAHAERKTTGDWIVSDEVYEQLGYVKVGNIAVRPPKPKPWGW
jgi:Thoeris protein ThsB, TIR-like domain